MQPPKCANSYASNDGTPGTCKGDKPGVMTLTVAMEDGGELAGSRSEVRGLYCQDCTLRVYHAAARACGNQGRALAR